MKSIELYEGGLLLATPQSTQVSQSERAILVHIFSSTVDLSVRDAIALELKNLAETAGVSIVGEISQALDQPHSATLMGSGKLEEVGHLVQEVNADVVIVGSDLTGTQLRNIETVCLVRVVDRTQLILDIFANRAVSHEGKAQVKLAQLSYLLPRLIGRGMQLSRLGAGIGTRGPGETQLELDRRKIRKEIGDLKKVLAQEGARRKELRKRRVLQGVYSVGIIGYTNAGKTTLLSNLVNRYGEKAVQTGENRLFDTLDLVSRRVQYAGRTYVCTDTVGFLRQLPHHLIDAFRATLEEAVDADVLIHVVDVQSASVAQELETVYEVLERDLHSVVPIVAFFNEKSDALAGDSIITDHQATRIIRGSVMDSESISRLMQTIDEVIGKKRTLHLCIPHDRSDVVAEAYRIGIIENLENTRKFLTLDISLDEREVAYFLPFSSVGFPMEEPFL